jgi:hypothetical protein
MKNLGPLLKWLYPDARPYFDWRVQQDAGKEPELVFWDVPGVERPTEEFLRSKLQEFEAYRKSLTEGRDKYECYSVRSGG